MEQMAAIVRADQAQRRLLAGARSDRPMEPPQRPRRPRTERTPARHRLRAALSRALIALGRFVAPPGRECVVACPVSPSTP